MGQTRIPIIVISLFPYALNQSCLYVYVLFLTYVLLFYFSISAQQTIRINSLATYFGRCFSNRVACIFSALLISCIKLKAFV